MRQCAPVNSTVFSVHTSLLHPEDGKIKENTNGNVRSGCGLLPCLATSSSSTFELHHHDGDVVGAAAVEGLKDDALSTKVRLIESLADKPNGLLIAEGVPQSVGSQDHELWLQFVQVKGHDIRVGDHNIEVFQRVIPKGAGHGEDALDSPRAIKTDETSWKWKN